MIESAKSIDTYTATRSLSLGSDGFDISHMF